MIDLPRPIPPEVLQSGSNVSELGPVEEKEREIIIETLRRTDGNKQEAARLLGWYSQKLYNRLKRYGLAQK